MGTDWGTGRRARGHVGVAGARAALAAALTLALALVGAMAPAAGAATVSGTVTGQLPGQSQTVVMGAVVTIARAGEEDAATAVTDGTGRYAATVEDGTYDVHVDAGGYGDVLVRDVALAGDRRFDVVLVPAGMVRFHGTVRIGSEPAAGFPLGLDGSGGGSTTTDANGAFSLVAQPGTYKLRGGAAVLDDGVSLYSAAVPLLTDREVHIALPPLAQVRVQVQGPAGQAVAGAVVSGGVSTTVELDGVPYSISSDMSSVLTDAAGEGTLTLLRGLEGSGRVTPPARSSYLPRTYAIPPVADEMAVGVTLAEQQRVRVSGVVRDEQGPVAGAHVSLGDGFAETAADGSYAVLVPPGSHKLRISQSGSLSSGWALVTPAFAFQQDRTVDLTVPARESRQVEVRDPDGAPVPDARVALSVRSLSVDLGGGLSGSLSVAGDVAYTGAGGLARLIYFPATLPSPATGSVSAPLASGLQGATFELQGAVTTVTLQRRPTVNVRGAIMGPDGPIAGARLTFKDADEDVTAADGTFSLDVPPAARPLFISYEGADGWSFATQPISITQDLEFTLTVPAKADVTVQVLGDGDTPVAGAKVSLVGFGLRGDFGSGLPSPTLTSFGGTATTGADGLARLRVFPGSVRLPGALASVRPPAGSPYPARPLPVDRLDAGQTIVLRYTGIDGLAPQVTCDPPPGDAWQAEEVAVPCVAEDGRSGLADPADAVFELETSVGEGDESDAAQTGSRVVCDAAGNCATTGPYGPFKVDRQAPRVELLGQPDGNDGWWISASAAIELRAADVTIASMACSVDGVARAFQQTAAPGLLSGGIVVTGEGRHAVGCTATDALGHVATSTRTVGIDRRAPLPPTASFDRPPEHPGGGGWHRDEVTILFRDAGDRALADGSPGSGVDPDSLTAPVTVSSSGTSTVSGTVADRAGHVSPARTVTVRVDDAPPSTTLSCPAAPVRLGARAVARWQDADDQSGLAGPARGNLALDTSAVGWHEAERSASDRVGHVATATCSYQVVYDFVLRGGLLAPPLLNAVAPGVAIVPIRYSLGGDRGPDALRRVIARHIVCVGGLPAGPAFQAAGTLPPAWEPTTSRYRFDWDAEQQLPPGTCAELLLVFDDGTERAVRFAR